MSVRKMAVAPAIGLAAAIFASPMVAHAQEGGARDAAIAKCVKVAHMQYPDDDAQNIRNRSDLYKACMTEAGHRP